MRGPDQPQYGSRQGGFAGSGFADQPESFARIEIKTHVAHGGMNAEVLLALLRRLTQDRTSKMRVNQFTHFIDNLLVAAVANPETDSLDGIVHDLEYAKAEIDKAIKVLKNEKK